MGWSSKQVKGWILWVVWSEYAGYLQALATSYDWILRWVPGQVSGEATSGNVIKTTTKCSFDGVFIYHRDHWKSEVETYRCLFHLDLQNSPEIFRVFVLRLDSPLVENKKKITASWGEPLRMVFIRQASWESENFEFSWSCHWCCCSCYPGAVEFSARLGVLAVSFGKDRLLKNSNWVPRGREQEKRWQDGTTFKTSLSQIVDFAYLLILTLADI